MEVKIVTDVETEPVELSLVKDFCRIDPDYTGEDATLTLLQASARELLEGFLNLSLAPKVLDISYTSGCLTLPFGPHGDIVSVTDSNGEVVSADNYGVAGIDFKTIYTNYTGYSFFYPINSEYPVIEQVGSTYASGVTVRVPVGYTSEKLQSGLKHLILRLVDYMYQNRGSQVSDLPNDIRRDATRYSRNLVL